ncbi:MAG TPA: PrgI family protein [Candidatus Paceibacterota bacterium]|nr:PrgI family protein [Candidatus Paceibacterota bacterium]
MRFQIPQFIQTEINIVGPFTLKQFLWIAAGGTVLFLIFSISHSIWAILIAIPVAAISLAFAFLKIDDMPLINYVANAIAFTFGQKKYLFQPEEQTPNYLTQTKRNG